MRYRATNPVARALQTVGLPMVISCVSAASTLQSNGRAAMGAAPSPRCLAYSYRGVVKPAAKGAVVGALVGGVPGAFSGAGVASIASSIDDAWSMLTCVVSE